MGRPGQSQGFALTYSGGSWSKPKSLGSGSTYAVSCASDAFCIAVSDTGDAYTLRGVTWSPATDIYPPANSQPSATDAVDDVSCADPGFCVAVTAEGKALTWNGNTWSTPQAAVPGIQPPLFPGDFGYVAVSFATSTYCLAGTGISAFQAPSATRNGSQWSATPQGPVEAADWHVSCATATFCMAAGRLPCRRRRFLRLERVELVRAGQPGQPGPGTGIQSGLLP